MRKEIDDLLRMVFDPRNIRFEVPDEMPCPECKRIMTLRTCETHARPELGDTMTCPHCARHLRFDGRLASLQHAVLEDPGNMPGVTLQGIVRALTANEVRKMQDHIRAKLM